MAANAQSAPAGAPGALDEPQVRAMFDRIAGLYDRMNSVMTAGLHHQWRRRAADLAELSPGARALDVATGTGDLALELAAPRRAGRRGGRRRLLRADARAGAGQGRRARVATSSRATRSRSTTPTTSSTPPPSASAPATSPTSSAACRRWRGSCAPAAGSSCSRSRPRGARRCRRSSSSGSTTWSRRSAGCVDSQAYSYLPSSVKRFPGPEELAARMWDAGLREIRYVLTAGGIIALHVGVRSRPDEHWAHRPSSTPGARS